MDISSLIISNMSEPIIAPEPYVVPPIPEKTFPDQFVTNLGIRADLETIGIYIETSPYSQERSEIYRQGGITETRSQITWEELYAIPEVVAFFQALKPAIPAVRAYIAQRDSEPEEE